MIYITCLDSRMLSKITFTSTFKWVLSKKFSHDGFSPAGRETQLMCKDVSLLPNHKEQSNTVQFVHSTSYSYISPPPPPYQNICINDASISEQILPSFPQGSNT